MRIGVLTGGGDCPGLNAAIRAVVRRAITEYDDHVLGIKNGWEGLVESDVEPLSLYSISGILPKGGTILGTSRRNPLRLKDGIEKILNNVAKYEFDALVIIGGDDTLGVANKLGERGMKFVGIPKTLDNDLQGTDQAFGFDTAVSIATDAIDRLHTTAESHHRVIVVEVMGRYNGAIATAAGLAGGADFILIPEVAFSFDEMARQLALRHRHGKNFSIVVVAAGAKPQGVDQPVSKTGKVDEFGHPILGGIGEVVAREIEKRTDMETRVVVLGSIQRGGTPTALDRLLATRFGIHAVDMVHGGKFGYMAALRGTEIVEVPVTEAIRGTRPVDPKLYETAKVFFG
ncbi:MAG: ATP-dependent 6-phosphofructokinase [candidate division KSB1 bacterium]|nr:ATP-dependent 6-phosphofructokinase [candidate division KSB1 bacterium]MDZ7367401.1 ATP-dependent 6-phosphofructokinase [candidate division KSB1 bacterium]MDZ7405494.1 ATP-dependent 6-phosphofructokinase [candidate division KSB1 bacterium]